MYGINNNTGLPYNGSNSIAKIKRQDTNATGKGTNIIKKAFEIKNALSGLKSESGFNRLISAATLGTMFKGTPGTDK